MLLYLIENKSFDIIVRIVASLFSCVCGEHSVEIVLLFPIGNNNLLIIFNLWSNNLVSFDLFENVHNIHINVSDYM